MLPAFKLAESECITLQEIAEHHPYADFRRRALGIIALSNGHPFPLVAEILGISLPTPYNWLKAWNTHGLIGLLGGHQGGLLQVHGAVIVTRGASHTCVGMHAGTDRQAITRNPPRCATVQPRLLASQPEKARLIIYSDTAFAEKNAALNSSKPSLFYLYESGFPNIPNVQRAWSPKGKPHVADASVARQRVNVVGALDYTTGRLWHDLHGQKVKRNAVTVLIDRIAQQMPLTLVVLDNARIHHHFDPKKLDEWLVSIAWSWCTCRRTALNSTRLR